MPSPPKNASSYSLTNPDASNSVLGSPTSSPAFDTPILARFAVSGIGPFPAEILDVRSADGGLTVSLRITNEGSSAGSTTCRLIDPAAQGSGRSAFVLTSRIAPGATLEFDHTVTDFGSEVRPLAVDCAAP